jgi:L-lactate dehydrogenase
MMHNREDQPQRIATSTMNRKKVVVVGAGAVGSTFCYALAQSGFADEIALIDQNEKLLRGQVLDLAHGQPFFPSVAIHEGDVSDYDDAQVVVVTAGSAQRSGQSRLQLAQQNATIIQSIVADVVRRHSPAVVVIASNPVDVMTHVAIEYTGWDKGRVLGSGTVLDSARLRHLLSRHCGVDVHNVHAYMLGEHGDSEFAAWSMTHIGGMPIEEFCPVCARCADWTAERKRIEQEVRDSAYHIIDYKGATYFAIGLALVRIVGAIVRGESSVLTVSTKLDGEFGIHNVCLSVPCLVSGQGVARIIESRLSQDEVAAISASAAAIRVAIDELHVPSDSA